MSSRRHHEAFRTLLTSAKIHHVQIGRAIGARRERYRDVLSRTASTSRKHCLEDDDCMQEQDPNKPVAQLAAVPDNIILSLGAFRYLFQDEMEAIWCDGGGTL